MKKDIKTIKSHSLVIHLSLKKVGYETALEKLEKKVAKKTNKFKHFDDGNYVVSFDVKKENDIYGMIHKSGQLPFVHRIEHMVYENGNHVSTHRSLV